MIDYYNKIKADSSMPYFFNFPKSALEFNPRMKYF